MKVRLVTSLREFDALESVWRELTGKVDQISPFLTHDWFACCWRTTGPVVRRELWLLEDVAGPLALIPLVTRRTRMRNLPVRNIRVLDWSDAPLVDLPVAGDVDQAIAFFLDALRERGGWDVLSLPKLTVGSPIRRALDRALPTRFRWSLGAQSRAPYVTIEGTWKAFLKTNAADHGDPTDEFVDESSDGLPLSVEEHRAIQPDGRIFAEFIELSRETWDSVRGFATPGMTRFFEELSTRATLSGSCRLWILRIGGRAVATEYQLGNNGCLYTLRSDAERNTDGVRPRASLAARIIRELFERGEVHEYHMGAWSGQERARWASGTHETATVHVYAPTAYGALLHALESRRLRLPGETNGRGHSNGRPECA
jgi:CelD/BcsL family acetyltransferase involved in cellulose biosynthesis